MRQLNLFFASLLLLSCSGAALAQAQTKGTLVVIPAFGEVKHANDEAQITLMIEEQDKDKAAAASRVNLKMKQGIDIVKREDPNAILKTRGYYTYPIYPEDQSRQPARSRQPASWRVGQYLDVTTKNLERLPKTVAAAQRLLALNGLHFRLSEAVTKKLDQERIDAAYKNLNERIASIAKAMGRSASDAVLDTIDFEGSGNYVPREKGPLMMARANAMSADVAPVEEPSFEPGETTLQMQVVGKIRFK